MFPEKYQICYNCAPRPLRTVTRPTPLTPSWSKPIPFNYSQHTCNVRLDQSDVVLRRPHVLWMMTNRMAVVRPNSSIPFNASSAP